MKNTIEVKIKGAKYKFKANSIRGLFMYEEMTGKNSGEIKTLQDNITVMFCILASCNRDSFNIKYDEFLDLIEDGDDGILEQLSVFTEKK
jgi:hypothetical protein